MECGKYSGAVGAGLPITKISLGALRRNWRFLRSLGGPVPPLAVIKADAYGHGLIPVAKALMAEGCVMVAVGSVAEGVFLRSALGREGEGLSILPLLGLVGEKDAALCIEHTLIPLVSSARAVLWLKNAYTGETPFPVAVKVETGMSRLGFRRDEVGGAVAALRDAPNLLPSFLLSHLAAADDPSQDASVSAQAEAFMEAFFALRVLWPDIIPSLANTAAFLLQDKLLRALPPHMGRPGYALYGGNPLARTSREAAGACLEPVMSVTAPVLGVHALEKGAAVSYGRTFIAPGPMKIAVVGAGYADGFPRALSGRGHVSLHGVRCPVLGRVCMQMHVVDASRVPEVACGDEAFLLGGAVSMEDVAEAWGTIPYEVFCIFGKNTREYV